MNVVGQKRCECGCGALVLRRYVSGHNAIGKQRRERTKKPCLNCAVTMVLTPAKSKRTYCSTNCRDEHRRALIGPSNPRYKRDNINCPNCGKPLSVQPSKLAKNPTCSRECGQAMRVKKIIAANKARPDYRKNQKELARIRDGFKCRVCSFDVAVHVHHIVRKADGGSNRTANYITLCPNHHAMVHAGLITSKQLFAALEKNIEQSILPLRQTHRINFRKKPR